MAKALTLNPKDAFSVKPNLLPELFPISTGIETI
jgi:hypothetical protein